jgi:hypothetical protein
MPPRLQLFALLLDLRSWSHPCGVAYASLAIDGNDWDDWRRFLDLATTVS